MQVAISFIMCKAQMIKEQHRLAMEGSMISQKSKLIYMWSFPQTPGPGIYEYKNQLDEGKRKNKGFCFGSGRSEM